jgi:hypothetical protein
VTYDLQTRWLSGSTFGHHRRQVIAMAVHVDKSAIAFRDSFFGLLVLGQVIGQRLVEAIFESDQLRVSIRISEPINTNQHQSTPTNTNQHQSSYQFLTNRFDIGADLLVLGSSAIAFAVVFILIHHHLRNAILSR